MKRFIVVLSSLLVLPAFAEVAPVYYEDFVEYADDYDADAIMTWLLFAYLGCMLALLVLNRTHLVVKQLFFRKKKDNPTIDTNNQTPIET